MASYSKYIIKTIAVIQIVGGISGLISILLDNQIMTAAIYLSISLYSLSIYAGIELFKFSRKGIRLTYINQFLQILLITSPYFSFLYFTGFKFGIGILSDQIYFMFEFGAKIFFSILMPDIDYSFGVNIIPIIIMRLLYLNKHFILSVIQDESQDVIDWDGELQG